MLLNENEAIELAEKLKAKYKDKLYNEPKYPSYKPLVVDVLPYNAATAPFSEDEKKWVFNINEIYDVQYGLSQEDWNQSVTREWKVVYILYDEFTNEKNCRWAYSGNL